MINITEVRIKKLGVPAGELVAVADITIDDCFVVHNIDVLESDRGVHIKMPDRRTALGGYKNIVHPITNECRLYIQNKIADAYMELKKDL